MAAVAIPAFGLLVHALDTAADPAWGARLGFAGLAVSVILMGRAPRSVARFMPFSAALMATSAMAFFGLRMHQGNVSTTHLTAFQLIYILPLIVMSRPVALLAYSGVTLVIVLAVYQGLPAPEVPLVSALASLGVLGFGTALASLARGRAEGALEHSRQQLEVRVQERTAQLQTEVATRRAAEADAIHASRVKSRFLATMSHELRTPLNAILGYTELVQEEANDIDRADMVDDLERVRTSARHLLRMVSDVLDVSRIEAGEMTIEPVDLDVGEHLQELRRLVEPERQRSGSELVMDLAPGLWVRTDPSRLAQISINLVTNALKFTHAGTVTVHARCDDGVLVLAVEDTGIGIGPDDLDRVFQSFVQVDGSSTRTRDGVGLGLSLSKDLAQRLGGTLTARSKLGEGSTFTLRLPGAWRADRDAAPTSATTPAPPGR